LNFLSLNPILTPNATTYSQQCYNTVSLDLGIIEEIVIEPVLRGGVGGPLHREMARNMVKLFDIIRLFCERRVAVVGIFGSARVLWGKRTLDEINCKGIETMISQCETIIADSESKPHHPLLKKVCLETDVFSALLKVTLSLFRPDSFLKAINQIKAVNVSLTAFLASPGVRGVESEQGTWFRNLANGLAGLMTVVFDVQQFDCENVALSDVSAFLRQIITTNANCENVVVGVIQCGGGSGVVYRCPSNDTKELSEALVFFREIDR